MPKDWVTYYDAIDWQFATDDEAACALLDVMARKGWNYRISGLMGNDGELHHYICLHFMKRLEESNVWIVSQEFTTTGSSRPRAITECFILAAESEAS